MVNGYEWWMVMDNHLSKHEPSTCHNKLHIRPPLQSTNRVSPFSPNQLTNLPHQAVHCCSMSYSRSLVLPKLCIDSHHWTKAQVFLWGSWFMSSSRHYKSWSKKANLSILKCCKDQVGPSFMINPVAWILSWFCHDWLSATNCNNVTMISDPHPANKLFTQKKQHCCGPMTTYEILYAVPGSICLLWHDCFWLKQMTLL